MSNRQYWFLVLAIVCAFVAAGAVLVALAQEAAA